MLNLLIRTFIIYAAVIFVMRLMGKRQIGQLQPFEMVITIIIADLAAMPMQDEKIPLARGVLPLAVLLLAQTVFSYLVFRKKKFRTLINGTPLVLIAGGKLQHCNLRKSLISFCDIIEAMHESGIDDFGEIDYAILETNGKITIFPKKTQNTGQKMSFPVIMNGEILKHFITFTDVTQKELEEMTANENHSMKDVLFGYLDSNGKLNNIYTEDNRK